MQGQLAIRERSSSVLRCTRKAKQQGRNHDTVIDLGNLGNALGIQGLLLGLELVPLGHICAGQADVMAKTTHQLPIPSRLVGVVILSLVMVEYPEDSNKPKFDRFWQK